MEIRINGKALDVKLDNENTIGEILSNIESWLTESGHRISEINIDGKLIASSMIEEIFRKEIKDIKNIDINTNALAELTAASLMNLLEDIKEYENLGFEKKTSYFDEWDKSAAAAFIKTEIPDLYAFCVSMFSRGDMAVNTLVSITEEIQREVNDPVKELSNLEQIVNEICEKLISLPLDIQTGKDIQAAKTIQVFSAVTEKLFRLYRQLEIQRFISKKSGNEKPISGIISEFNKILKELLAAYEKNDYVLVGDLTEYEASPKLKELYQAIIEDCQKTGAQQSDL